MFLLSLRCLMYHRLNYCDFITAEKPILGFGILLSGNYFCSCILNFVGLIAVLYMTFPIWNPKPIFCRNLNELFLFQENSKYC